MCEDGRYPSDFQTPKTVQAMRVLDSKSPEHVPRSSCHEDQLHFVVSHSLPSAPSCRLLMQYSSNLTKTVLTDTQLDRILLAYGLQTDHNALRRYGSSEMTHSSTRVRNIRLHTLWESLGAYKLVDYDKMKKGMI